MTPNPFSSAVAILLIIAIAVPSVFLLVPQRVHAQAPPVTVVSCVDPFSCIKNTVETTITAIKSTLTEVNTATTAWATTAAQINTYVLQPLAFVLSGNLLKAITAGVIAFVIGKANGTGVPQFVTDVQKSMQTVSDTQALAFFDQFGRNSNSPFASSIASALRFDYLSKTSLAGFWAANMNTLAASTPTYRPGYLAGNWEQGGLRAWFALTTQTQNNPYTFYANAQSQLGTLVGPGVGGATGARLAELGWGQGFLSWCGPSDDVLGALTTTNNATPASCPAGSYYITESRRCEYQDGSVATPLNSSTGKSPGDACMNKDGTRGTIKTPGSVISAALNKALGTEQDRIVRMGNVGPEINSILRNVSTVFNTVNLATQILGGPDSGGLFGMGEPSGTGSSASTRLTQYQATPSLGVTNSTIYQNQASAPSSGADMTSRIAQYQSAWGTIANAANAASTTVNDLAKTCAAQAGAAQTALAAEIAPVLAQAVTASSTIATARAAVARVQSGLASGTDESASVADLLALQSLPPTTTDVARAEQDAQAFGVATAIPAGSLTVSGGSLVDQMSLIASNAAALKASCNASAGSELNASVY